MKKSWHQQTKRASKESRTSRDGILFASKGEMQYWEKLKLWQLAGDVRNLRRQVSFPLVCGEIKVLTDTGQIAKYTADFVFERRIYIPIIKPKENLPNRGIENQLRQIDRIVNPPIVRTDEWVEVIADYKGYAGKMEMFRIRVFEALYNKKVTIVKG